jgi:hypothetical protein
MTHTGRCFCQVDFLEVDHFSLYPLITRDTTRVQGMKKFWRENKMAALFLICLTGAKLFYKKVWRAKKKLLDENVMENLKYKLK